MATSSGFVINLVNSDGTIASNTGNNQGLGITDAMLCSNSTWAVPYYTNSSDSDYEDPDYDATSVYDSNGNYDYSLYNATNLNTSSYNGIALPSTGSDGITLPNGKNVIGFFFPWYLFTNVFSGQTINIVNQSNSSVNIILYIPSTTNASSTTPSLYGCAVQQPGNDNYYNTGGSDGPNGGFYWSITGYASIQTYVSSAAVYWLETTSMTFS